MGEKKSLKELKELFAALAVLSGVAGAVMKDGKLGVDDLTHLVGFGVQFQTMIDGFSGLDEAMKEAKDLDQVEVIDLLGSAYDVVKAFEAAKA